jgi:hypothetical protein
MPAPINRRLENCSPAGSGEPMLRNLKELERYTVSATDGDVGKVDNFLFDDERWAIRYLVVQTGGFFQERRVLISPISFREVHWSAERFELDLTKDKIKSSPDVDTSQPVSRQRERDYYCYYDYPYYWGYMGVWGAGFHPTALRTGRSRDDVPESARRDSGDVHLRSARAVAGYGIQGTDGGIGFVKDFIVDDETWEVRYLVVDTSRWWWGQTVLVAPNWATQISWADRKIFLDLSQDAIKKSPPWDGSTVHREYEVLLHDYHRRPGYWGDRGTPRGAVPQPRLHEHRG